MKLTISRSHPTVAHVSHGFALIVTLSLMILLTVVAVGLLTLSSVSLRSSSQGESMQIARANARLALMLALGDLQKQLGPDTRISATADQIAGASPDTSSTPAAQRHWTGAYRSWPAATPNSARPAPEFLQWFVSGQPQSVTNRGFAATAVSTDPKNSVEIVTKNAVGDANLAVRVPLLAQPISGNTRNTFGWWTSDLGTKGHIARAKTPPTAVADVRADQQSAPATNIRLAAAASLLPFQKVSLTDPSLQKIASWDSSSLVADQPASIRGLFHDLAFGNRGLLTNVRAGGFRKDLSMFLERTTAPDPTSTALYRVGGETGINFQELWAYYTAPQRLTRSGAATFTTGGTMATQTPHFQVADGPIGCLNDDAFYLKQPVIINYQMILSLRTVPTSVNGQTVQRLHLVADPVLTFWNPLDVPVIVPSTSYVTVKYWQIPYDLQISVNGGPMRDYSFAAILSGARTQNTTSATAGDGNFMSLQVGVLDRMAFKPGEVIKWSQSGNMLARNPGFGERHRLGGMKGFNFGGGVALPVRDLAGQFVDVPANATVTCQTKPNNLTAGATNTSGRSVTGGSNHSRHFSLTHHEYHVGDDRYASGANAGNTTSVGIGTMAIDFDFGNRRLRPGEIRADNTPGTKVRGDRIYADESRFSTIFQKTPPRDFPVFNLSTAKQPLMVLSFEAKTENGSDTRTRFLSRFNPRALHVDFYSLSDAERQMLPYEYRVEPLSSWKNRSIEVSSNGGAFYGGGMTASDGTSFVATHSIPREPIVSLAAFQHSFANGFDFTRPKFGYASLNSREPMLPQISHAIGNSIAPPVLAPGSVEGTLAGGRPLADHSYLANQALWDDWFLSGIAPQTLSSFSTSRTQKVVASDFFNNAGLDNPSRALPVTRYAADLRGQTPDKLLSRFFPGSIPTAVATDEIASYIRVDGMFNVNSTSIEAWKSVLGGRKDRPVIVRDASGRESVVAGDGLTPVAGLLAPENQIAPNSGSANLQDPSNWVGRRTLSDPEIDRLARAIVQEVRKRGPFLSLGDFVNRRVGSDKDLARAGAIQSALDSRTAGINAAYAVGNAGTAMAFPEAEAGTLAYGSPGVIKQADILTPIAPILSARSDSFLIRGYGERTDATGKVVARAWCEATVQRTPQFVDPTEAAEKSYSTINALNRTFGRRFEIVSFRWLSPTEA